MLSKHFKLMKEKSMKFSLEFHKVLLTIFTVSSLCAADQFVSFKKLPNNLGSFGLINRKRVEGYRLNGNVTLSQEVIKEDDCFELCLKNSKGCQTFNVVDGVNDEEQTIKTCELIDGRAFTVEGNLEQDINSVHYGLETQCWNQPCQNNGVCLMDYTMNSFSCDCNCYKGDFCEEEIQERSCAEYNNPENGVYKIILGECKQVYCDMENGRWTMIQRRIDGSVDFNRDWQEYKNGFGDASGEYWLGNDAIHLLTKDTCKLNFTMKFQEQWYYAYYDSFSVGDESSNYVLAVSGYQGNAGDSFGYHNGGRFSTPEVDNDEITLHCAEALQAGWWYRGCHQVNPNGVWGRTVPAETLVWLELTTHDHQVEYIDMKVLCSK